MEEAGAALLASTLDPAPALDGEALGFAAASQLPAVLDDDADADLDDEGNSALDEEFDTELDEGAGSAAFSRVPTISMSSKHSMLLDSDAICAV
jgi:hypothetical protein